MPRQKAAGRRRGQPQQAPESQGGTFRLLVGQHIGRDPDGTPTKVKNAATGELEERFPSRAYREGELVTSDADLVAKFGAQKFERVGGTAAEASRLTDAEEVERLRRELSQAEARLAGAGGARTPGDAAEEMAAAARPGPHGQVTEGFQQTATSPTGRQVSGPISREEAERQGVAAEPTGGAGEEEDDYDDWTASELRAHASEREIDLGDARRKDEIVAKIRAAGRR